MKYCRTSAAAPATDGADHDVPDCELYWVPLSPDPGLLRGQDTWLLSVLDQLKNDPS